MTGRRKFFARAVSGLAILATPRALAAGSLELAGSPPDESWLRGLNGKHKLFFDAGALNGGNPLARAATCLDVYRDSYGAAASEVNLVFGAHGAGLCFVLGDSVWSEFDLGARYSVIDKGTGQAAKRNVFAAAEPGLQGGVPVPTLQARGIRFLGCRQSIARLSRDLAAAGHGTEDVIKAQIEHGLLTGVTAVPAMVVAADRAQEAGLKYLFVG